MSFQTMPQTCQTRVIPRILVWLPLNGASTFSSLWHCQGPVRTSVGIFVTLANRPVKLLCWMLTSASWETLAILLVTPHYSVQPGTWIFKQVSIETKRTKSNPLLSLKFFTSGIQLANYNVTDIAWLFNILGSNMMYAKAEVWETRRFFNTHYHLIQGQILFKRL